jgi:hypothetical protein
MKSKRHKTRTLALEIRLRRVGFAAFEGSDRLLDWGIRRWRADADPVSTIVRLISPLLSLYSPSVVVLKHVGQARKAKQRLRVILAVKRKVMERSIEVHIVRCANVKEIFRQSGSRNKYESASSIAQAFPELRRKVPPQRKAWQPERYNAVIFDAVALALTHQSQCEICVEPSYGEAF